MGTRQRKQLVRTLARDLQPRAMVDFGAVVERVTYNDSGQVSALYARVQGASGVRVYAEPNTQGLQSGQIVLVENKGSITAPIWMLSAVTAPMSAPAIRIAATTANGFTQGDVIVGATGANQMVLRTTGEVEFLDSSGATRTTVASGTVSNQAPVNMLTPDYLLVQAQFFALPDMKYIILEPFDHNYSRGDTEPKDAALVKYSTLVQYSATPNEESSYTSKTWEDFNVAYAGASTAVGSGYLEDTGAHWWTHQYTGYTLKDSAGTAFTITSCSATTDRLGVSGTPAAGAYTLRSPNPTTFVPFCYLTGSGDTLIEVTFDGGTNWQTVYDDASDINLIGRRVAVANSGVDVAFRLILTNDANGDGPCVYYFGLAIN